jgi:TldD protein
LSHTHRNDFLGLLMDIYAQAEHQLLTTHGLSTTSLEAALGAALGPGITSADLYFQATRQESWGLEDGIVKEGSFSIEQGVGVRSVAGEKVGFAYSDELSEPALAQAANSARAIVRSGQNAQVQAWKRRSAAPLYAPIDPIETLGATEKVLLLRELDAYARSLDPRIAQVMVGVSASVDSMLIAASDGTLAGDVRPMIHMRVTAIAEQNGRREVGSSGGGGRFGFEKLLENDQAKKHVREAVRLALLNLEAIAAPAGQMPIVLGAGWPGILLHEAVGHGLEGDFNRKGTSAFSNLMGTQVAAKGVTIVDDGTINDRRGSLTLDDEGTPSQCTTLIEDGVLKGYLQDKLNSGLMKTHATGNGRRESFAHLPMPRMTNTYMRAGDKAPDEIIRSVKKGLYAVNFGGGQVDITSGKFVFSASEAYLIEDGKIGAPVKGATIIGNGPEAMRQVSMIGNDLKLDLGIGTCGKDGQSVPVGVGQPTLRIEGLTVGGTQA